VVLLVIVLASAPVMGLIKFDFEQPYYVHPGRQVWDFCVVRPDSTHHIFYHTIPEDSPGAANADTIWHATSNDLFHWNIAGPVLTVGPDWWDGEAIWAPDVAYDSLAGRWIMAYTGVDSLMIQRPCLAFSYDLFNWTKGQDNPVFEPDSLTYYWSATTNWSSYRDPFLYRQDGLWHMLSTAHLRVGGYPGYQRGILHRLTTPDFQEWTDAGVFYEHNGAVKWHDLESGQYHLRDGWHHLFFTEQDPQAEDHPTSHMASATAGGWDMADREFIDPGWAPEINQFDPGIDIFARLGKGWIGLMEHWFIVVRFDTLLFNGGSATPQVHMPHPLDRHWAVRTGSASLGNPTFGDNPTVRGEPSCGLVGNGWYGSQEYYQGPLTIRDIPGAKLGNSATGVITSYPFIVTGDRICFLIGGGYYPETCYIALLDAEADTILLKETGTDQETMTQHIWNVRPYAGMLAAITIVDQETGWFGHINIDEIEEIQIHSAATEPLPPTALTHHDASPNPGQAKTTISFALSRASRAQVRIYDLRGRRIWTSPLAEDTPGRHTVSWQG
jgi:hypothetical protein